MKGCLQHLIPHNDLNNLWASSWSGASNMPTLWANSTFLQAYSRIGAVNRCGAYCEAWGCGANQTHHYTSAECAP